MHREPPANRPATRAGAIRRAALLMAAVLAILLLVLILRTLMVRNTSTSATPPVPVLELAIDLQRAANRLGEAIRIRTIANDATSMAAGDPFAQMREWLSTTYPAFHAATTRTVLDGGTLVFEWPGRDRALKPVILMAHQDVVPEGDVGAWTHAPFSGEVTATHVWGRGAIDNKSSLVAMFEAAEGLLAAGWQPARTVFLVFGHDEETAGAGAAAAAAMLAERGVRALLVLDEGSLVVADHPVTGGPAALIGVNEKGYATVRVTARAAGGHASAPPEQTAVGMLAAAVDAIVRRPFPRRYEGATRAMLEALAPEAPLATRLAIANAWLLRPVLMAGLGENPQGAAMLHTTLAPTMLTGAPRENMLATEASAWINLRIAPGDTVATVMAHLQASVKGLPVTLELVGESRDPVATSPAGGPEFARLAGAVQAVFGVPVAPAPVIAATDSRSMQDIADHIYRFQPLRLSLAEVAMIHGVDERIGIDALGEMIRFYGTLLAAEDGATAASASTSAATIR